MIQVVSFTLSSESKSNHSKESKPIPNRERKWLEQYPNKVICTFLDASLIQEKQ